MKQEASGWPDWCDTEEKKRQYIGDYERKEGIKLNYDNIKKNPGLRSLSKLMLNSFWGKFGQRDNLPQVELVKDPERYFKLLTCQATQVKNIQFVNDECVEVYYTKGDDCLHIQQDKRGNRCVHDSSCKIETLLCP